MSGFKTASLENSSVERSLRLKAAEEEMLKNSSQAVQNGRISLQKLEKQEGILVPFI
jgi:hypothetical protein